MELAHWGTDVRFPGFIGPSYTLSSVNVDCQRCMNLYPEMDALGTGKEHEVASLVSTPGLTLLCTLPASPVRGAWVSSKGVLYVVGGNKLYSISSAWAHTELGSLNTATGPVSMADNGLQLVVVDGPNGYSLTLADNTFAQITDSNFLGSSQVTFQDGYFIFIKPDSQQFYCSDLNAITFSALNTGSAEGSPDNLVGQIDYQQSLYLFGTQSCEVFYDSGDTPCPFTRIQGAVIAVGCAAPFSIAKLQSGVFWIGGDDTGQGIVYQMQGYQPTRISTQAIESSIRSVGVTNLSNAKAYTYQQGGHVFYCLNVPGLNFTWVYDVSTGLWHERTFLGKWGFERHRADCAASAYGVNIVGDYASGNLYSFDALNYTDNGTSIVRMRAAPHFSQSLVRIFHQSFQLDMEAGVGLSGLSQGINPQAMLQWSDDGGHTWSNEKWTGIGQIGATKTRVIWRRLGASRDRVYRIMISDPVKVTLIGAELGVEQGVA